MGSIMSIFVPLLVFANSPPHMLFFFLSINLTPISACIQLYHCAQSETKVFAQASP